MYRLTGILGIAVLLALCWALSTNRKAISWRIVIIGILSQVAFAFLMLNPLKLWILSFGPLAMKWSGDKIKTLLGYAYAGSEFVFGALGASQPSPNIGFVFAFMVLPAIVFVSAFFALLYHLGIMQVIIRGVAWVMAKTMRISGAESTDVAASIFMGQTEAPLVIRPFLAGLTYSELMTVMTAGMAHVSGSIMSAYIAYGALPEHLLAAVIMTAPGTILVAKMLVPETETPKTLGRVELADDENRKHENILGAIARGTIDGGQLAFNVAIMLISFIALVALLNGILGGTHNWLAAHGFAFFPQSLQQILGWLFAPVAWLIGIPRQDIANIGQLLGTRMVINELVAFRDLGAMKAALDPRSFAIATFAICGFANFSSIGIQIGGIGALVPERRAELAKLGLRAMLAGTIANLFSAAIVGIMYS